MVLQHGETNPTFPSVESSSLTHEFYVMEESVAFNVCVEFHVSKQNPQSIPLRATINTRTQ